MWYAAVVTEEKRLSGTGLDPVLAVLIAQMIDNGTLDGEDIANMARRLHEGDDGDLAMALYGVMMSAMIDQPENRRAAIHVISDNHGGGNPEG